MTGLSDNHKRRILTSLQYADKLLAESLQALTPGAHPLFSGHVQDLSPSQSRWVESYAARIRKQMSVLLERCQIELPSATTLSSGKLRTNLTSLDVTLEDIYPEKLRGYGKIDSAAAHDLSWTLRAIRRLVSQLLAFLSESKEAQDRSLGRLDTGPELTALLERMAQVIANRGLVEFLPALNALIRNAQPHPLEIAVFGKPSSGKSSLINRLLETELLPIGATPITAVPVRIVAGSEPRLRVSFLDRVEELPVGRLAEYGTEENNPGNSKRVVAIEVWVESRRLWQGCAFVYMPGIGYFATGVTQFASAHLPDSGLALVLVDGRSSIGGGELGLLRALKAASIPAFVMISKCDLLPPEDVERVVTCTRETLAQHLDSAPEVVPAGSTSFWVRAVNDWFERAVPPLLQRPRQARIDSVEGKAQALQAVLLTTLEAMARCATPEGLTHEAERLLRLMDESLTAFERRWKHEFGRISAWKEEILEQTASNLASRFADAEQPEILSSDFVVETVMPAVASHCHPFLQEYQELSERISTAIHELKENDPASGVILQELPRLSALPSPLTSPLAGVTTSGLQARARISQAARARYFRKELEEKLGIQLRQILEELQPRLMQWFLRAMNALEESLHLQTDPLRYRSPSQASAGKDDTLTADITFLRSRDSSRQKNS
jgi:GTP-binding protein EngB required for normal cell division